MSFSWPLKSEKIPLAVPPESSTVNVVPDNLNNAGPASWIPPTVPEEIQAIIDSYLTGCPLLLVVSNKRFFDHWSLRLPKEFGFFMLGYFRILGVQVLT